MFDKNGFSEFMGYRTMAVERKIEKCLSAVRRGETEINMDCGDLTNDETEYLQKEVVRRMRGGE